MSIIGKNIKKLRVLNNLNQKEMGELFNIGRGSIGSYEEGRAEPKIETVIKMAEHFNLSIDQLLKKELTVNELSDYANIISKHLHNGETNVVSNNEPKETRLFLEQRVSILEEKVKELLKLLK